MENLPELTPKYQPEKPLILVFAFAIIWTISHSILMASSVTMMLYLAMSITEEKPK